MTIVSRVLSSCRPAALAFAAAATLATYASAELKQAKATNEFLDSVGIVTTWPDRGQPIDKTIEMVKYVGFRWVRAGIEGVSDKGPTTMQSFLDVHKATGVKFSWGLVSGGTDLDKLFKGARVLHRNNCLLAFEGNNEPNNWGVTYKGVEGGGKKPDISWKAVAMLQADLYKGVKADRDFKNYPVWGGSEMGAQNDNVGLQFLTIPEGQETTMPMGTKYADAVNIHNYIYHPNSGKPKDNKAWLAASPGRDCDVDGLFGNHGITWHKKFPGYTEEELKTLPRVCTETGTTVGGEVTEERQALDITNFYLAMFTRGWSHTSPYILRDRTDEGGNQKYGFYTSDYQPRMVATYVHNLTSILADKGKLATAGQLDYVIDNQTATVHDLLLHNSDGNFQLVIWGEKLEDSDKVTIKLAKPASSVKIYDPTKGVDVIETKNNVTTLELEVTNHPFILVIPSK